MASIAGEEMFGTSALMAFHHVAKLIFRVTAPAESFARCVVVAFFSFSFKEYEFFFLGIAGISQEVSATFAFSLHVALMYLEISSE